MYSLEKNTQVNFRTNSDLLERAKEIISEYNLDMTASFNLFLENIKNYIETMYFSEQAGINTVNNILHGLERLTNFPEAGFNADERVGKIIYPPYKTRCIVLGNYLAFYHILEDRKSIFISNIIHSKQDYIRLFKRKS